MRLSGLSRLTRDNLNRVTLKNLPGTEPDVTYVYDNLDRPTSASQTGNALSFTYDALSRKLTETGPQGTATSQYDAAGRRTQLTYPGTGLYVNYDYLVTGEVTNIRENGATSGVGVLATYSYDDLRRQTGVSYGNGAGQTFTFDPVSRLASLSNDLSGTANDLAATFGYNPASQIASTMRTGDAYAFTAFANQNTTTTVDGLNQPLKVGTTSAFWDSKGNLVSDPVSSKFYSYSSENLLIASGLPPPSGFTLGYDPLKRLYQVTGAATTRFAYDGVNALAEYDGSNTLRRRYVFGPGMDNPIVQYEGTGTTDRYFMGKDERGSVISLTDSAGALIVLNRFDEYGYPQSTNRGRFQYTGQMVLNEIGAYNYKARVYLPHLGIFAQTDPAGYDDSPNLYAYVGNDPVNNVDPLGLDSIVITGKRLPQPAVDEPFGSGFAGGGDAFGGGSTGGYGGLPPGANGDDIVVVGRRSRPPPEDDIVVTAPRIVPLPPAPAGPRTLFLQARSPERRSRYNPRKDYCGAEGGQQYPSETWNEACSAHDDCYAEQRNKTTCDVNLGADAIAQCLRGFPSATAIGTSFCIIVGITYGGAVYFRGQPAYDRANQK